MSATQLTLSSTDSAGRKVLTPVPDASGTPKDLKAQLRAEQAKAWGTKRALKTALAAQEPASPRFKRPPLETESPMRIRMEGSEETNVLELSLQTPRREAKVRACACFSVESEKYYFVYEQRIAEKKHGRGNKKTVDAMVGDMNLWNGDLILKKESASSSTTSDEDSDDVSMGLNAS